MSRIPLSPLDSMFLLLDTAETPMHVGALMPFEPPPGQPADLLRTVFDEGRTATVAPPWNRRLVTHRFKRSPVHWWTEDEHIDLEYHVRRSALPSPGDERELGIMVARLHSNPLDMSRPPWELHIIEGLSDGRYAIYVKIHHSLVDGISGMKMLARSLSTDPEDGDTPLFFSIRPVSRGRRRDEHESRGLVGQTVATAASAVSGTFGMSTAAARAAARLSASLLRLAAAPVSGGDLVAPLQAPHSILNSRITRQRRFATQQYTVSRLKAIAKATGTTLNDVVLAVCGGGLRTYLQELGELPDRSLVAFLPVSLRSEDDPGGGNAVGAVLSVLGTEIEDPLERLRTVHASASSAKDQMRGMDQTTAMAYSAAVLGPASIQAATAVAGVPSPLNTFNLCISNVPGPRKPLYFRGARLQAIYPLSIPTHGMALNITLESYADTLAFGFIGCRETLPSLQKLAVYTGEALEQLEAAVQREHGTPGPKQAAASAG